MGGSDYAAEATAETDIIACALSANQFEAQLHASSAFRSFVFDVFARRLGDMMMKIEQVAFSPLDQRLAKRIEQMRGPDPLLTITHEQLAADLGSSREVVSRRLAKWEDHGLIERGHRSLRIVNAAGIARLAQLGD
jgi:CRP/FNR family transcriptional regulator